MMRTWSPPVYVISPVKVAVVAIVVLVVVAVEHRRLSYHLRTQLVLAVVVVAVG